MDVCAAQGTGYDRAMPLRLTPRQRAELKGRAHALGPVVQIGQAGASAAVIAEVERALTAHGLIKVKLAGAGREARDELATALCEQTGAAAVQQVGRMLTLWRPRPDEDPLQP
jgi:putative YhbY family RNA-binding protein